MGELNFETGLKTFTVNGRGEIAFNPTDSNLADRILSAFEQLDAKRDTYEAQAKKLPGGRAFYDFCHERDLEMRGIIDGVFGTPVSDTVFGGMNAFLAMGNGLPIWANFLLAVLDEMNCAIVKEQKLINPRIAKYTAKYHK